MKRQGKKRGTGCAEKEIGGDRVMGMICWWLMIQQGRARLLTWCDCTDLYLRECSISLRGVKESREEGVRWKWGHKIALPNLYLSIQYSSERMLACPHLCPVFACQYFSLKRPIYNNGFLVFGKYVWVYVLHVWVHVICIFIWMKSQQIMIVCACGTQCLCVTTRTTN